MAQTPQAVKVSDRVHWVGAIDWSISDFHGYNTSRGTSYNAYLVLADKVTLIDTVKGPFADEMMSRIASVVDPSSIEYVVSNHAELDHAGSLPRTVEAVKPSRVFASRMGKKALARHHGEELEVTPVKDGEELDLGGATLRFLETRMLHWPDSMFSYLVEESLLFSQDGFGMHLASSERFADQIDDAILDWEAAKYFANILLLYSPQVLKLLDRVEGLGLAIDTVAPDHGPIWRKDVGRIVGAYAAWAEQKPTSKAVVLYDSMWGSTERMARAVAEGLAQGGASPRLLCLKAHHRSDVATELLDAGALLVGSPTLNNTIFPTLADAMSYLKGLRPRNLVGAAFGSYGWSGESVKQLNAMLDDMGVERLGEGVRVQYIPDDSTIEACHALGLQVAGRLTERAAP